MEKSITIFFHRAEKFKVLKDTEKSQVATGWPFFQARPERKEIKAHPWAAAAEGSSAEVGATTFHLAELTAG